MINKRVLVLSNYHIQAYHVRRNKVLRDIKIDLEKDYQGRLGKFLGKDKRSPVYLICNVQEEEYRIEKLPHTGGRDRKALMQRKLQQFFRGASYGGWRVLGREKTGRKDDRVLFHALPQQEVLDKLLLQLHELGIPVAGLYSQPLLLKTCMANAIPKGNFLILTEIANEIDSQFSFRQCFYRDGELSLSRISAFSADCTEEFHRDLIAELESSHHYLTSHHSMGYGEKITTLVLASAGTLQQLGGLKLPADYDVQYAPVSKMARVLKLSNINDDDYFDDVLAGYACKNILLSSSHYHSEKSDYHIRHHNLRWGLAWAAAVAFMTTAVETGSKYLDAESQHLDNENLRAHLTIENQRILDAAATLPRFDQEPAEVEDAVKNYQALKAQSLQPLSILRQLTYALSPFPEFSVQALSWQKASDDAMDAPPPDPLAAMPVLPDDPMLMMTETDNKVSYDISVSIDDHSYPGGLRDKLKRIDQFNTRLHDGEKIQGLAVSEWPVDLSPSAKIERSLSAGSGANTSPTFTVEFQMVQESP
jgi:hypothetical protein